jgi:hypothetical protein
LDSRDSELYLLLHDWTPLVSVDIKTTPLIFHSVVVLEMSDDGNGVVLGDPLRGKFTMSRADFEDVWYRTVIVVYRNDPFEGQ